MRLQIKTSWDDLRSMPGDTRVVWAVCTCWWYAGDELPYTNYVGLPCDPHGSMLMQGKLGPFLDHAERASKEDHYGRHGLEALMSAYHGNLTTDDGRPTSLLGWEHYNKMLDKHT